MSERRLLFAALLALVYLLLPGHPLGWLSGLPLGPFGLALLVGLSLSLFAARPLRRGQQPVLPGISRRARAGQAPPLRRAYLLTSILAALCLLKVGVGIVSPAYGLEANYDAKPGSSAPVERSTEFPNLQATRLDLALNFEGAGFPLYFFNDNVRFNYYREDEPDRGSLPFAVRWRGLIEAPFSGNYDFWLTAAGGARLLLPAAPALTIDNRGQLETVSRRVSLAAGSIPIELEYIRRGGEAALFSAEWNPGSGRQALAAPSLLARPSELSVSQRDILFWLSRATDIAYLAALLLLIALLALGVAIAPERAALALLLALVFGYAAISSLDLNDRGVLLDGGSDWLTYETYARDILQNGPLMTLGRPLGRGRPYFFQPFYPYALAAAHWLTGEDLYGVAVLQLFGLGVSAVLVYELGKRLFGRLSGTVALLYILLVLGPLQLDWVARRLLSENIYFWLLPATALAFIELGRQPSKRLAVLSGLLLGLCCVTRGPTLLWAPPLLLITWWRLRHRLSLGEGGMSWQAPSIVQGGETPTLREWPGEPSSRRALAPVGIAALACFVVLLLVPLRNLVVSGQPSPLASNAVSTMELAHPLTPAVDLRGVERNPLYRALRLDYSLIQMIEFVRQDPLGYAATLAPLGLYALGLPGALEPGEPIRWELVTLMALYVIYLAGAVSDRRRTKDEGRPNSTSQPSSFVIHSFIGAHFLTMLVFLPNSYGYRQVLPMYLFLAVFGGYAFARLTHRVAGLSSRASKLERDDGAQRYRVDQHVPGTSAPTRHEELT